MEDRAVPVILDGLDETVVFLMVITELGERMFFSVSRYSAKMYVFEKEELITVDGSSSRCQPVGSTVTVSGTACSVTIFQCSVR